MQNRPVIGQLVRLYSLHQFQCILPNISDIEEGSHALTLSFIFLAYILC